MTTYAQLERLFEVIAHIRDAINALYTVCGYADAHSHEAQDYSQALDRLYERLSAVQREIRSLTGEEEVEVR